MRATQYPRAAHDVTPARGSIVENAASKWIVREYWVYDK
jgi:hypothetical protein